MDPKNLIKCGDYDLVFKMIKDKDLEIREVTKDVGDLQASFKEQFKEKEDVILRLTKDNDEAMKKMILLESKIQTLNTGNDKT